MRWAGQIHASSAAVRVELQPHQWLPRDKPPSAQDSNARHECDKSHADQQLQPIGDCKLQNAHSYDHIASPGVG